MANSAKRRAAVASIAVILFAFFAVQAAYANPTGVTSADVAVQSLASHAKTRDWTSPDGLVKISKIRSGDVSYNKKTRTLTLKSIKADKIEILKSKTLNLKLVGKNAANIADGFGEVKSENVLYYLPEVALPGRSSSTPDRGQMAYGFSGKRPSEASLAVSGKGSLSGRIAVSKNFTMESGTLQGQGASKSKDRKTYVVFCGKNFTMKGGKITAKATSAKPLVTGIVCQKSFSMQGGKINFQGVGSRDKNVRLGSVISAGKMSVAGGTISLTNCDDTGIYCEGMVIKKGSISIDNQRGIGLYAKEESDIRMSGGSLAVTRDHSSAICAMGYSENTYTDDDKTSATGWCTGGKVSITGGKLIAETRNPNKDYAVFSGPPIKYKSSCIKSVRGFMPEGFTFEYEGGTYKVTNMNGCNTARLISGGGESSPRTVTYGGSTYEVD